MSAECYIRLMVKLMLDFQMSVYSLMSSNSISFSFTDRNFRRRFLKITKPNDLRELMPQCKWGKMSFCEQGDLLSSAAKECVWKNKISKVRKRNETGWKEILMIWRNKCWPLNWPGSYSTSDETKENQKDITVSADHISQINHMIMVFVLQHSLLIPDGSI